MNPSLNANDAEYRQSVRRAIHAARAAGAATLTAICREARGAYPTIVNDLLLEQTGHLTRIRDWTDEQAGLFESLLPEMPEPHPIDYEWRYTSSTADALAAYLSSGAGRIACLGTPTVFVRLRALGKNAVLFDRNPGILGSIPEEARRAVHLVDMLDPQIDNIDASVKAGFDAVLLDPPWYPEHVMVWFAQALRIVRPGGRIILTLFPDLVRPSAAVERERLQVSLREYGRVAGLEFRAFYTTPLFEHETLTAFGLGALGHWRSGDLVCVTVAQPDRSVIVAQPIEPSWDRVRLGMQVVAVRTETTMQPETPLRFEPIMPDGSFLLKSVSARDPNRSRISVWTSRNRALRVASGGSQILPFLTQLAAGSRADHAMAGADSASRAALQILQSLVGW